MFVLHDEFLPHHGVPQNVVYAAYLLFVAGWLVTSVSLILRTDYVLLLMAFACFAVSMGTDAIAPETADIFVYEDSVKLTGIVSWLAYFQSVCRAALKPEARVLREDEVGPVRTM